MTETKREVLTRLGEEFRGWEERLTRLSDEQIASSRLRNGWSVKDLIAHLMAWQQVTLARLEAARHGTEPVLPEWLAGGDPEAEEEVDRYNARIYETYRNQPWPQVYRGWREGFAEVLRLGEETPEGALLDGDRYSWLNGHPLITVLQGTYEHHHQDHLEPFLEWLQQLDRRTGAHY